MRKLTALGFDQPYDDATNNLKKGEHYVLVELTQARGVVTPEDAVQFAIDLIQQAGLPYTVISLRAKRDDPLVRTPVPNNTPLSN